MPAKTVSAQHAEDLAGIVRGRRRPVDVDASLLRERLEELLSRFELSEPRDELEMLFRALAETEETLAEKRKRFDSVGALAQGLIDRLQVSETRSSLNALARVRLRGRAGKRSKSAHRADAGGRPYVRHLIDELSALHDLTASYVLFLDSQVAHHRPVKSLLDDVMFGLAEIYIELRTEQCGVEVVPHSEASHFIRFASAALDGCFHATETSPRALSRRWKRIRTGRYPANPTSSR